MSVVGQKRSLTEYFDWNTLRKGKDYFDRGKVLRQWQEDDGAHCGEVSGSNGRSYKAILFLEGDGDSIFSAGCSCPVGKDCKHTAALLLSILTQMRSGKVDRKRAEEIRSLTIMGEQKQPALISADSLAPEVKASFRNLAQYLLGKKSIDATAFEKNKNRRNSIVYILGRTSYTRAPNISICSASILKNGSYGTMRNLSVDRVLGRGLSYAQPEDMEVAQLWTTITRGGSYYHYYTDTHIAKNVDPELFKVLMARVLATGRCFFESCNTKPLALGDEQSGSFAWQKDHGQWRLGFAVSGSDPSYVCLPWTVPYYVNETTGICGPVRFEGDPDMAVLDMVLAMRALTEDEARALPALLHPLGLMDLVPPPCCDLVVIKKIEALPSLCLEATTAANHFVVDERLVFQKGEVVRAARVSAHFPHPPAAPYIDENGVTVFEQQDTEGLSGFRNRLCDLGLIEVQPDLLGKHDSGDCYFIASDAAVWSDFDEEAVAGLRSEGWQISTKTEEQLLPVEVDPGDMWFESDEEESWWFSLALRIKINGKMVPLLPILISAIRRLQTSDSLGDSVDSLNRDGKFYAPLDDGTIFSLPFERIRSVLSTVKELIEKGLDPNKVSLVDASETLEDQTLFTEAWIGFDRIRNLVERLKTLKHIPQVEAPEGFGTQLRDYQLEGLSWLQFLAQSKFGGILADDMGLGKTVQLLAHVLIEKQKGRLKKPYLVVCPTSVLPNWLSETERFAPQLEVVSYHGMERHLKVSKMKKADLIITTYPILTRDLARFEKMNFHGIVLDEAQAIKNYTTKLAQAARSLKAGHKFCLTGTPIQNHLGELWSQFQFLLPGLLSDYHTFKQVFRDPIEKLSDDAARQLLAARVKPFIVRRTKQEVASELPEKTIVIQNVELEGAQRDLYETVRLASTKRVRDEIKKKGFKYSQIMILDALLKLRQACCHPRLVKLEEASKAKVSAKLVALIEMLGQLCREGRKILVFSQFTSMLDLIAAALDKEGLEYVSLRGDTRDRVTPVKEFQQGDVPIFLISLKAGGTGLNLTAADTVIHYDPWWNPAVEEQATDRAHRIGQDKKVFVYKLIAKGTIEERMIDLQNEKRKLAGSIYDSDGNLGMSFTQKDLDVLLMPISSD